MRLFAIAAIATSLLAGTADAQVAMADSPQSSTIAKPVAFSKIVARMRPDEEIGTYLAGAICVEPIAVYWEQASAKLVQLDVIFAEELKAAGLKSDNDPNELFGKTSSGDLQVGAIIQDVDVSGCASLLTMSGKVRMTMEWQVYSSLRQEVVAKIATDQTYQFKGSAQNAKRSPYQDAFALNVRELIASPGFRAAVALTDKPSLGNTATNLTPISLTAVSPEKRSIPDASGSVVAIFAGDGHGSGFLVSSDGYLITNQHVVGGSKYVKVRWSDGFETLGEVIRSDKRRDVALVKTDPHGRSPLSLRRGGVQPAETVFALGTPLDPKFQGTVTKGIVSSTRILDGFSFIQSDVTVNPGNSGGPLLDEKGAVVGITVSGYRPDDLPTGINLFIPIGDALDFLNLKPGA